MGSGINITSLHCLQTLCRLPNFPWGRRAPPLWPGCSRPPLPYLGAACSSNTVIQLFSLFSWWPNFIPGRSSLLFLLPGVLFSPGHCMAHSFYYWSPRSHDESQKRTSLIIPVSPCPFTLSYKSILQNTHHSWKCSVYLLMFSLSVSPT